jgi:hypothetical protein
MASAQIHQRTVQQAGSHLQQHHAVGNALVGSAPALGALRWKASSTHGGAAGDILDASAACFKQAKEHQAGTAAMMQLLHAVEPTSVLDLQTSPGRSCSSTVSSLSSQQSSLWSHDVADSSSPALVGAAHKTITIAQDQQQLQDMISCCRPDHRILDSSGNSAAAAMFQNSQLAAASSVEQALLHYAAGPGETFLSWMDSCMEDAHGAHDLELTDFEECDVGDQECPATSQLVKLPDHDQGPIAPGPSCSDMDFVNAVDVQGFEYGMNQQLHMRSVEDHNSFPSCISSLICDQQADIMLDSEQPGLSHLDEIKFFNSAASASLRLCRVPAAAAAAGPLHELSNDHASVAEQGSTTTTTVIAADPFSASTLMFTTEQLLSPAAAGSSQIMNILHADQQQPVLTTDDQSIRLLGRSQNLNYNLSNVAISCSGDQSGRSSTYTSTDHHGSQIFIPSAGQQQHLDQADNSTSGGLQLVHLLLGCAEAIDASEYERAGDLLCHLRAISSPQGDPMQRIAFHFAEALSDRRRRHNNNNTNLSNSQYDQYRHKASYCDLVRPATNSTSRNAAASACSRPAAAAALVQQLPVQQLDEYSDLQAYQAFYEVLPFAKFAHFTGNQAILEAVASSSRVHVVDLEIGQGLQWPAFFQSLVLRPGGPPAHLRMTAVGSSSSTLQQTGRRLTQFVAGTLVVDNHMEQQQQQKSLQFEYNPVTVEKIQDFHPGLINLRSDETLVVNCSHILHKLLAKNEETLTTTTSAAAGAVAALENMLLMIRSMGPTVVCLLEVEANHDVNFFMSRFVEALHYFCALFDTLEATLPRDSPQRNQIENTTFAAQIKDIVAAEGWDRQARHLRSHSWQSHFQNAGFRLLLPSSYAIEQAHLLLALHKQQQQQQQQQQQWVTSCSTSTNVSTPYKLAQLTDSGVLTLGWHDTPIIAVSSWTLC